MRREEFLRRVGAAVMASGAPAPTPVQERLPELAPVDLLPLFRERAQEVNAVVHGPVSRHGAPKSIVGIAAGHDCRTFMAWDEMPAAGVAAALASAGMMRVDHQVPAGGRLVDQEGFAMLDLGVTGSLAGLAESGSVVLAHGVGRPRMASLLPEVHIALLDVADLGRTLSEWAARHPGVLEATSNLVVVTGPSRTGDIELKLNLGVHGPRHVHVVLVR